LSNQMNVCEKTLYLNILRYIPHATGTRKNTANNAKWGEYKQVTGSALPYI